MSIAIELENYATYLENAYNKAEDKGATIPQNKNLYNLTSCIDSIPTNVEPVPPEAGTPVQLLVMTLPQVNYTEGDSLNLTGIKIGCEFSNGYTYNVTGDCIFICNNPVTYYDTKIQVTYSGLSLDIPIFVLGIPVLAPTTTTALYHLNGNLINEVTGNSGGTGTYTSHEGKFGTCHYKGTEVSLTENINVITQNEIKTGNWTIEWWGKYIGSDTTGQKVVNFTNCAYQVSNSSAFLLLTTTGSTPPNFSLSSSFKSTETRIRATSNDFTNKVWHHYAVVFNSGTFYTFLDGLMMYTGTISSNTPPITRFGLIQTDHCYDEILICNEAKYLADFEVNHGEYYLSSNT